uniref:F-box protein 43 n=1 Tax=Gasterosteus aculeatus TaxID=69293 RepID=G3NH24_GASAC
QRPPAVSWCETPKVYKRHALMRHRILMCKPSTDVKADHTRSPRSRKTESSISVRSEHWLDASFDSLDTLKLQPDLELSGRKRRLLFNQVRTSTLEDGKQHSGYLCSFEGSASLSDADFNDSISASDQIDIETPRKTIPLTHIQPCHRSVCEDSGFGSLTLDKSQDSSVDHDGSFLELLSTSRGNPETPNLTDARRRSRLQRQNRLSTLKEGGSQSEEDPARPEHLTPLNTAPVNLDATPLREPPVNLSLTPALQLIHAMCQLNSRMFVGQSPSLKEQLKSTEALAQTPVTLTTTMPLAGLIGRKMGLRKVDILTELRKRNLGHILCIILSHLSSESIYMFGRVSKEWNQIIHQDKRASIRRKNYLSDVEAAIELGGAVHVPDAETRHSLPKRSALKTVQAQSRTSSFCTPKSGSSKRDKFLEVAQTLFNDECLKPCPRCQHPARCHSVKQEGVCSRADCDFRFCTACLCAFHGSRECGSQSVGRRKKDILLPGSAQSKRNVRRL